MASRDNVRIVNQLIAGNASDAASRPSVAFGDADTGIYEDKDDNLSFSTAGTQQFKISGSDVFFLRNMRSTSPGAASGGGYLFVSGGSLQFVGSSGTITRLALP